jgi:hypothetical protein
MVFAWISNNFTCHLVDCFRKVDTHKPLTVKISSQYYQQAQHKFSVESDKIQKKSNFTILAIVAGVTAMK